MVELLLGDSGSCSTGAGSPSIETNCKGSTSSWQHITLSILDSLLASKPRWSFNHEVSLRSPQQEGCPHMCFVQVWFYTSTTGMAVGPDHMANWDQQQRVKTPRAQSARSTNSNRTDRTDRTDQTDRAEAAAPRANSPRKRTNQPSRRQRRSKKSTNTFRGDAADGPSSWFQEPTWSSNYPGCNQCLHRLPASSAISSAEKQLRTLTGMLNVVLPDLPRHITPLQIHHLDDFVILFQERPCAYA